MVIFYTIVLLIIKNIILMLFLYYCFYLGDSHKSLPPSLRLGCPEWCCSRCPVLWCPWLFPSGAFCLGSQWISLSFHHLEMSSCSCQHLLPAGNSWLQAGSWDLLDELQSALGGGALLNQAGGREEEGLDAQTENKTTPLINSSWPCVASEGVLEALKLPQPSHYTRTRAAELRFIYLKAPIWWRDICYMSYMITHCCCNSPPQVSIIPVWYKNNPHIPSPAGAALEGLPNFIKSPLGSCLTCPQAINSPSPFLVLQPPPSKLSLITRQRWITDKALRSLTSIFFPIYFVEGI